LPRSREAVRRFGAEEVGQRRLAETVEMLVGAQQCQLAVDLYARLLEDLSTRGVDQTLAFVDAARRDLSAGVGVVAMLEDEQPVRAFDVDEDTLPHRRATKTYSRLSSASGSPANPP
jgi:hypothetical protein